MHIIYNPHHHLHHVIGRFIRRAGEAHLHYYEPTRHMPAPDPSDDKETPERWTNIQTTLHAGGLQQQPAQDHGLEAILRVHDVDYLHFLQHVYREMATTTGSAAPVWPEVFPVRQGRARPQTLSGQRGYYAMDVFTPIVEGTWQAAYWSAQTACTAATLLAKLANDQDAIIPSPAPLTYALCRPSGHHASWDVYGGFCFLNNAAVAAQRLRDGGFSRVAILDIDFHHGNGTQQVFYNRPDVVFVSLHGHPDFAFPYYSGWADERGEGEGVGTTLNLPLPRGTDDSAYLAALVQALAFIAAFAPDALVVSAGFDIMADDPYGGFRVSLNGLQQIGHAIGLLGLPTCVVQEGGYQPDKLGQFALTFLNAVEHPLKDVQRDADARKTNFRSTSLIAT